MLLGLCTMLLVTGITKIDPSLYEAAELDGAGVLAGVHLPITLPGLRQEIGVCVTVTVIAALASFDIVYIATGGGPGLATTVPGLADLPPRLRPPPGRARLGAGRRPDDARPRLRAPDPAADAGGDMTSSRIELLDRTADPGRS